MKEICGVHLEYTQKYNHYERGFLLLSKFGWREMVINRRDFIMSVYALPPLVHLSSRTGDCLVSFRVRRADLKRAYRLPFSNP